MTSDMYFRTLVSRFDELEARRLRHGGTLGPDARREYDIVGRAIEAACDELGINDEERDER